ncbi:hypothetical protein BV95_04458 [Sphingobium chlorophenolicum]|uniref:Uncharacterized protein n=1 Tax=Sphingobium chlorophenolicum TaxID=46429 RepID=A0A081R7I7_SPHCR|nr:hypothetical protein BV95_04458 [Sphingobium chlorophenolicum]
MVEFLPSPEHQPVALKFGACAQALFLPGDTCVDIGSVGIEAAQLDFAILDEQVGEGGAAAAVEDVAVAIDELFDLEPRCQKVDGHDESVLPGLDVAVGAADDFAEHAGGVGQPSHVVAGAL